MNRKPLFCYPFWKQAIIQDRYLHAVYITYVDAALYCFLLSYAFLCGFKNNL